MPRVIHLQVNVKHAEHSYDPCPMSDSSRTQSIFHKQFATLLFKSIINLAFSTDLSGIFKKSHLKNVKKKRLHRILSKLNKF